MECHEVSLLRLIGVCKASVNLPSRFTAGGRVGAVSIPADFHCEWCASCWLWYGMRIYLSGRMTRIGTFDGTRGRCESHDTNQSMHPSPQAVFTFPSIPWTCGPGDLGRYGGGIFRFGHRFDGLRLQPMLD